MAVANSGLSPKLCTKCLLSWLGNSGGSSAGTEWVHSPVPCSVKMKPFCWHSSASASMNLDTKEWSMWSEVFSLISLTVSIILTDFRFLTFLMCLASNFYSALPAIEVWCSSAVTPTHLWERKIYFLWDYCYVSSWISSYFLKTVLVFCMLNKLGLISLLAYFELAQQNSVFVISAAWSL